MFTRPAIYNSAGSERISMKFGALRVYCPELAPTDFGRDPRRSESGSTGRNLFFLRSKQPFPVSQISRNLHTRRGSMSPWILSENIFENLPVRGLFPKKANFCVNIVNDFRLQAAISPKWLQIALSHDRLARLQNAGFPLVPLESTQSFPWPVERAHRVYFWMRDHAWFT